MKDSLSKINGTLTGKVIDRQGNILSVFTTPNLVVSSGYTIAAEAIAGVAGTNIDRVAIGTNPNPANVQDTAISNPVYTPVTEIEHSGEGSVKFHFHFTYEDAVGMSVNEFGLMAADGRLFSRKVRETIEKTDQMSIVGVWEINFAAE